MLLIAFAETGVQRLPDVGLSVSRTVDAFYNLDIEGMALSPLGGAILVISEVVEEPLQDWDDSAGGDGIPFNDVVGNAAPDPTGDQWVEIFNASPTATAIPSRRAAGA